MDPKAFLRILAPFLDTIDASVKQEILTVVALAMEETADVHYNDIRNVLRTYNVKMPKELRCKECLVDDEDDIISCEWCGRYFHTRCTTYDEMSYCSKQCNTISKNHS